jgi:hypothetical protein
VHIGEAMVIIGVIVDAKYATTQNARMHASSVMMVAFIGRMNITSPMRNENSEACRRSGAPSTIAPTCEFCTPSYRKARIRARFSGNCRRPMAWM